MYEKNICVQMVLESVFVSLGESGGCLQNIIRLELNIFFA